MNAPHDLSVAAVAADAVAPARTNAALMARRQAALPRGVGQSHAVFIDHGRNAEITLQACPGLAKEIEGGELDTPRLRELVAKFAQPLQEAHSDTIVLGCTHYPFVRPLFEQVLGPEVRIIDTSDAVARHVAHLVTELPPCASDSPSKPSDAVSDGHIRFWSSGNPALLSQIVQRWFNLACAAQPLP